MTRFEFISQHGLVGAKLGVVSIEWLIKYDAYLTYREALESLKATEFRKPKTAKSEALLLAAKKCRCDKSCMARYIYAFERHDDSFQSADPIVINRSGHRWVANY